MGLIKRRDRFAEDFAALCQENCDSFTRDRLLDALTDDVIVYELKRLRRCRHRLLSMINRLIPALLKRYRRTNGLTPPTVT